MIDIAVLSIMSTDILSRDCCTLLRLYTKALNRPYDDNGLNDHTANYLAGGDLYQMAYYFIFSSEYLERELSDEDFVDTM